MAIIFIHFNMLIITLIITIIVIVVIIALPYIFSIINIIYFNGIDENSKGKQMIMIGVIITKMMM